jgi:hypothetical protein
MEADPKPGATPEVTAEQVKEAYKAFKTRLKLTRLDAESRIGVGPLSSGAGWGVTGIVPPHQFPAAVWDELVRQGKLKRQGGGLYSLAGN